MRPNWDVTAPFEGGRSGKAGFGRELSRTEAGGGKLEEDSDLSQFQVALKGQACTDLGGREGGKIFLLPSAPCLLPSEAEASVKGPNLADFKKEKKEHPDLRAMEVQELKEALADGRKEYLALLTNWLSQQIPSTIDLDEILIGGGTAQYLKPELTAALKPDRAQLNWGKTLELRVKQAFETQVRPGS